MKAAARVRKRWYVKAELHYNLSFTTASLRPELARIVAEYFLRLRDWATTKAELRADNALQCRSANAKRNVEREMRTRVQLLTDAQLRILAAAPADDRSAMAWLAMCKRSGFVMDFAVEVLCPKLAAHDPELRRSDYEAFFEGKCPTHPELVALTVESRAKIRQSLLRMLVEAGLLIKGKPIGKLQRPVLSPQVVRAIEADSPSWFAGLLVPAEQQAE